jgi:hypothetical protein
VLATFAGWCHLSDQRPGRGDVGTHGQADEDETQNDHQGCIAKTSQSMPEA